MIPDMGVIMRDSVCRRKVMIDWVHRTEIGSRCIETLVTGLLYSVNTPQSFPQRFPTSVTGMAVLGKP
jgi:ribosomal protein S12 methylthiotransferase accessory factor YcaO